MELDFDLIDAAAKEHIREQEELMLSVMRQETPDLAGYSVGLETFQLMMGAFRAGVAWTTTNFEYNKNHTVNNMMKTILINKNEQTLLALMLEKAVLHQSLLTLEGIGVSVNQNKFLEKFIGLKGRIEDQLEIDE